MRAVFIIFCLLLGVLSAYFGQPLVRENPDAVLIIATVMTVFAGFLVAIIVVVGDPTLIPDGSWREVEIRRPGIQKKLITQLWLFVFYILTIGFLFVAALLNKVHECEYLNDVRVWVERIYLFFGATSFFFTFGLPSALWKLQLARIDAELIQRRKKAGIVEDEAPPKT